MLTIKFWCGRFVLLAFAVLVVSGLSGCAPSGPSSLLKGERLIQEKKHAQAIEPLRLATELLPANAQAWNHLGLAYHGAGKPGEAVRAYRQALQRNANLAAPRFNLGCLFLEQRNYSAAIAEFAGFTVLQSDSAEGWSKLGTAQLRSGLAEAAEASFQNALRLNSKSVEARNGLGLALTQRRHPREAFQCFSTVLQQQPTFAPALLNLAVLQHQHFQNRPAALQRYREFIHLSAPSEQVDAVKDLILQLEAESKPVLAQTNAPPVDVSQAPISSNAVVALQTNAPAATLPSTTVPPSDDTVAEPATPPAVTPPPAIEKRPPAEIVVIPSVPPTNNSGARVAQREQPEVRTPPERPAPAARDASPQGDAGRLPAATTGREAPQPQPRVQVQPELSRRAPLTPNPQSSRGPDRVYRYLRPAKPAPGNRARADSFFAQGVKAHQEGRLRTAVQAYQTAISFDPAHFDAHYNRGLAAYAIRDLEQALSAYEMALSVDATSADARFNFALTLQKASYPREAAAELENLVAAHPGEVRAHFALANLYAQELFLNDRARVNYRKVLALDPRHPHASEIRYWLSTHP
jgi:tetratricopeptide (TPR) repeat protein